MNKVILCEGETDAILLSYYLGKVAGWKYSRKGPENLNIQADTSNQSVNWYKNNENFLLICAVGGKDNFKNFFDKKSDFRSARVILRRLPLSQTATTESCNLLKRPQRML